MRKSILLLTFVSCFLMLSIPIIPSSQKSIVEADMNIIEDCGCSSKNDNDYPIFCGLLFNITKFIITLIGEIVVDFLVGLPFVIVMLVLSLFYTISQIMILPFLIICF